MRQETVSSTGVVGAPGSASPPPEDSYRARREHYAVLRDQANRVRYRAANLSAVLFLGMLTVVLIGLFGRPLLVLAGLGLGIGFVAAFAWQARLDERHRRYATLWEINDEGPRRLRREWKALPLRQPGVPEPEHLYAADLDLLGHASLQHLLNTATTPAGQMRLQDWLLRPAAPDVVRERQAAVRELAPLLDLRDELTLFGRLSGMTTPEYEHFVAWTEQEVWLTPRSWLVWLSRALPALTLVLLALQLVGVVAYPIWLVGIAGNLVLTRTFGKQVEQLVEQVSDRRSVFLPYEHIFRRVAEESFEAPLLRQLRADLAADDLDAARQIARLGRIMRLGDLRLSILFPAIQAALLWNFHTLWLLERWQRTVGKRVRAWLETLSELEALAALGTLAFDNPTWAFPELTDVERSELAARELGHPLLAPDVCVRNDVHVGPAGTFLLVTGSNMSGKSTLLRALGVNAALAQAGGPVCAASLRMPPVALVTSVRVQDSLEYGVSYFMAELRQLKRVVDAARQEHAEGARVPLFLLDEILHGTNTGERQVAARRIIRQLLALGATGAVSTHDLTLADAPELAQVSSQVHFTETFTRKDGRPAMSFDYRLRPGIATSTNALKLMEIVGLSLDDVEG